MSLDRSADGNQLAHYGELSELVVRGPLFKPLSGDSETISKSYTLVNRYRNKNWMYTRAGGGGRSGRNNRSPSSQSRLTQEADLSDYVYVPSNGLTTIESFRR